MRLSQPRRLVDVPAVPARGRSLLFQHTIVHEGRGVTTGLKLRWWYPVNVKPPRLGSSAAFCAIALSCASCSLDTAGRANAGGAASTSSTASGSQSQGGGAAATGSSSGGDGAGAGGASGGNGTGGGGGSAGSSSRSSSSAASTGSGPLPICGDGTVDPGETCDDGDITSGDGCSSTCQDEDVCPGSITVLGPGDALTINGDTNAGTNGGNSSGCSGYGANAPDLVFGVQTAAEGTLSITYDASYNGHIYVRTKCDDEPSEVACDNSDQTTLDVPASGGATYFVWIDGGNSEKGPFTLDLALMP